MKPDRFNKNNMPDYMRLLKPLKRLEKALLPLYFLIANSFRLSFYWIGFHGSAPGKKIAANSSIKIFAGNPQQDILRFLIKFGDCLPQSL